MFDKTLFKKNILRELAFEEYFNDIVCLNTHTKEGVEPKVLIK